MKPKRHVLMFLPGFSGRVSSGHKLQTVRRRPKRMPKPGDVVSLRSWEGTPYRSRQRLLREAVITRVEDVEIYGDSIHIAARRLTRYEREAFAQHDGFLDFAGLVQWFRESHGLPFEGIVIHWPPLTPDS